MMDYLEELKVLEEQGGIEVSKTKPPKRPQESQPLVEDKEYQDWYNSLPEAVKQQLNI